MSEHTGSCRCGNIKIIAKGPPKRVGICHCLDCRKYHGALFHASAIFETEAVKIIGDYSTFNERSFCPHCGSPAFTFNADETEISLGSFDAPDKFIPSYELWTKRRESWLPKFPTDEQYDHDSDTTE